MKFGSSSAYLRNRPALTDRSSQEFWYTNVLDQYRAAFPDAGLIGKGPFREVQLRIDGLLGKFDLFLHAESITENVIIM